MFNTTVNVIMHHRGL